MTTRIGLPGYPCARSCGALTRLAARTTATRWILFGLCMESLGSRLPVFPVERAHFDGRQIDAIDAADVEHPSARVEARAGQRVDSAMAAKIVLRGFRVELVEHQLGFAGEDAKARIRRAVPESALAAAQRAVAVDDVVEIGSELRRDAAGIGRSPGD